MVFLSGENLRGNQKRNVRRPLAWLLFSISEGVSVSHRDTGQLMALFSFFFFFFSKCKPRSDFPHLYLIIFRFKIYTPFTTRRLLGEHTQYLTNVFLRSWCVLMGFIFQAFSQIALRLENSIFFFAQSVLFQWRVKTVLVFRHIWGDRGRGRRAWKNNCGIKHI